jgi:hypothetical protein
MKQFKSDGRYKYYTQGFHYIVEFRWATLEDKQLFLKLKSEFTLMYGLEKERSDSAGYGYFVWKFNEYWRSEQNRNAKRRRIYLKEESALSLALLRIG